MTKKSHTYDEPAAYEPPPPVPEGDDVGSDLIPINEIPPDTARPTPADVVTPNHEDLNELMAGWWKEVKQLTLLPAQAGDHFTAYAAARGWQITEAPAAKSSHEVKP